MLIGVFRSEHPHAIIKRIDKKEACRRRTIHLTAEDVPGENTIGIEKFDQPILTKKRGSLVNRWLWYLQNRKQAIEALKRSKLSMKYLTNI